MPASSQAAVIHVPGDSSTIQAGIDGAAPGDTVLVAPGTYTGDGNRDIDFSGKGILLLSEAGPEATIIDCEGSKGSEHRGFHFHSGEDSSATVSGFTVTKGQFWIGAGVFCEAFSSPLIDHCVLTNNSAVVGGGINAWEGASPIIRHTAITANHADSWGGGVVIWDSSLVIENCEIADNTAGTGAAIRAQPGAKVTIMGCTITGNRSTDDLRYEETAALVLFGNETVITNCIVRDNFPRDIWVYEGAPTITYSNVRGDWTGVGLIGVNPQFVDPHNGDYSLCAGSPCIDAGDPAISDPDGTRSDMGVFAPDHPVCPSGHRVWHVATTGDDVAGDGSASLPFQTIQHAIDLSQSLDTVFVDTGTYTENLTIDKSIALLSRYTVTGDSLDLHGTILDGDSAGTVLTLAYCDSTTVISGFTIRKGDSKHGGGILCVSSDATISHNIIRDNRARYGGGIFCVNSSPTLSDNIVCQNKAWGSCGWWGGCSGGLGGGIYFTTSQPLILRCLIVDNEARFAGGGVYLSQSDPQILSSVISFNNGGGGIIGYNSNPTISNSIIRVNWGGDLEIRSGTPAISYCNVPSDWPGEGNVHALPLFVGADAGNFNVCSASPCIDAGDPAFMDPDGSRSDIGLFFAEHPDCPRGNLWTVDTTGNDTTGSGYAESPFRTIQRAVDASRSGDTVLVENGTYVENVRVLAKEIALITQFAYSGDSLDIVNTVLDGDSLAPAMTLFSCGDSTLITGLTITRGFEGLTCIESSALVSQNRFVSNFGESAINCPSSEARILGNVITGNHSGGISKSGDGGFVIDNIVTQNQGTAIAFSGSDIIIRDNVVSDNAGKGITGDGDSGFVVNNTVTQNQGDAIDFDGTGIVVRNNTVSDNSGTGISGGGSNAICRGNAVHRNGRGIGWTGSGAEVVDNVVVENGSTGISYSGQDGKITGNEVRENGWTYLGRRDLLGGGIRITGSIGCSVTDNNIQHNKADYGGGLYLDRFRAGLLDGNVISDNVASQHGGGLYAKECTTRVINTTLERNSGSTNSLRGGGIYCIDGSLSISALTGRSNVASRGGLLYSERSEIAIDSSHISACDAFRGAIMWDRASTITVMASTLVENGTHQTATRAALQLDQTELSVTYCTVVRNYANDATVQGRDATMTFSNVIIASNFFGAAFECDDASTVAITCSDVYGNTGGDWVDAIAEQYGIDGNMSVDPQFCDGDQGDYHLSHLSPLASTANACGQLIGSLGVGCTPDAYGDADLNGTVNMGDIVWLVLHLFRDNFLVCPAWVMDVNCDGVVTSGDVIHLVNYVFKDGPAPGCP